MTPKQSRFVDEYLIDLNATQAAIRAGLTFEESAGQGFYVYFLADEESGNVFYVGKGKGRRMREHVSAARRGVVSNGAKHAVIRRIIDSGGRVLEIVFCHCQSEGDSFRAERELIHSFRRFGLTNISSGTVTSAQANRDHAETLIGCLIPFSEWITSLGADKAGQVDRVFGSAKQFYETFEASLRSCLAVGNG